MNNVIFTSMKKKLLLVLGILCCTFLFNTLHAQGTPPGWEHGATPSTHIISVPLQSDPNINAFPLLPGDYIGVFYLNDEGELACGGASEWLADQNTGIIAFGNDSFTTEKDGFAGGETINFKFYSWALQKEYDAQVICDTTLPSMCDVFGSGGLSGIDSIWANGFYIVASATPDFVCEGTQTQLQVLPSGGSDNYTYQWTSSPPGFTSIIADPVDFPTQNTTYTIVVNDNGIETLSLTVDVETSPAPVSVAGNDQTICETASAILSGSQSNGASFFWTTDGDGTFNQTNILNPVYTPGEDDISLGGAILSLVVVPVAPCVVNAISSINLSVIALPLVQAGIDQTICEDAVANISAIVENAEVLLWTTSGDGVFSDPTVSQTIYTPGVGDIDSGIVALTCTAQALSPCTGQEEGSFDVHIVRSPEVDAGDDLLICETQTVILSGSANNYSSSIWTTSGDGTFSDLTNLNTTYFPGSEDVQNEFAALTLMASANNPCTGFVESALELTIINEPTVIAGDDISTCATHNAQLSGVASNYDEVLWVSEGDGTFSDPNNLNSLYFPGNDDILGNVVEIILTAQAQFPCINEVQDNLFISIQSPPTADAGEDVTIPIYESYEFNGSAENYESIEWSTFGDGTFSDITLLNPIYTPGIQDVSNAGTLIQLNAMPISPCNLLASDQLILSIDTVVGVHVIGSYEVPEAFPNPSKGKFSVRIPDYLINGTVDIEIYNAMGTRVFSNKIHVSELGIERSYDFSIEAEKSGTYFLLIRGANYRGLQKLLLMQ